MVSFFVMNKLGALDKILLEMRSELEKAYSKSSDADVRKILARLTLFEEMMTVILDLLLTKGVITKQEIDKHVLACEKEFRKKLKKHTS